MQKRDNEEKALVKKLEAKRVGLQSTYTLALTKHLIDKQKAA